MVHKRSVRKNEYYTVYLIYEDDEGEVEMFPHNFKTLEEAESFVEAQLDNKMLVGLTLKPILIRFEKNSMGDVKTIQNYVVDASTSRIICKYDGDEKHGA